MGVALLTGCGEAEPARPPRRRGARRVDYGADPQQYADLRLPTGTPKGTIVLVHGGYWQAGYGADLMDPLAEAFTGDGYATWNLEYRRVGSGGGFPATFEDVAAGIDRLGEEDLPPAYAVGHSAGGHLAAWAASRTAATPGGPPRAAPIGVASLGGLLDLTRAAEVAGSAGPTRSLMGGAPDQVADRYRLGDPALLVPASCPVAACAAVGDTVVPAEQARRYVAASRRAGGRATYVDLPGDHFTLIDPASDDFPTIAALVARAFGTR